MPNGCFFCASKRFILTVEYKEMFSLFDKKNEGIVRMDCAGDLLRSIGKNPTNAYLEQLSSSKSGLSFEEFLEMALLREDKPNVEDLIKGFQVFDRNMDGTISLGELRYILASMGEKLTGAEVDEILNCVDISAEGTVHYEKFVRLVLSG
jgi:calmodulin